MRNKALLFVAVALAQLVFPAWMIWSHERVLREGEVFRFRTAPIDPRDPFRGEYVQLEFEAESGAWASARPDDIQNGEQRAFGLLMTDSAGFARIAALVAGIPEQGAYLRVNYYIWDNDTVTRIGLPFDRFYLEEGDGAKTEQMLMPQWDEGEMSQPLPAYALVRVLHGRAVIEDLIVGDRSIHDWLDATADETAAWRARITVAPEQNQVVTDSLDNQLLLDEQR